MNKKILIIYDYFTPAFRAGGPTRSIHNLVKLIGPELSLFVISTHRDHDGSVLDVETDKWLDFQGVAQVFYASDQLAGLRINRIIAALKPNLIHINGIFSPFSTLAPLSYAKENGVKVIISPRGMLQKQSLKIKVLKKKIYLYFITKKYLSKVDISWHFTTRQEEKEFKRKFRPGASTWLIGNVPAGHLLHSPVPSLKLTEPIRLLTVALISPMKNHTMVLECLKEVTDKKITYDIIGPVKDRRYWQRCKKVMDEMPPNVSVRYLGEASSVEVEKKYSQYHYYIQPSQSENFGHSIFEAMACGLPVITSDQTPWRELQEKKAGWDVDVSTPEKLKVAIKEAIYLNEGSYSSFRKGARELAKDYVAKNNLKRSYLQMYNQFPD